MRAEQKATPETRNVSTPRLDTDPSLEETYRRLGADLTRFAAGMVGIDEAADVVASAVARCLRMDWSAVDNPDAYLYRAVFNEATGTRRRLARRAGLSHRVQRSPTTAPSRESEVDNELAVAEGLNSLSPQQRAVIVLTYWSAMPVSMVADHLELSQGAVKKQLARARARLREELS